MPADLENSTVTTGLEKVSFHPSPKEGQWPKSVSLTVALSSHASKVMLKKELGFNSSWAENFQMFKLDLEKAKEPEIKSPTSVGS